MSEQRHLYHHHHCLIRNIDMKISLAELEYRVEKDQIDIINLSQKIHSLRSEKDSLTEQQSRKETLYNLVVKSQLNSLLATELQNGR